jgi:zinc transporter ZupT
MALSPPPLPRICERPPDAPFPSQVGASLGVAIAVHNIPEGLCVAMPVYYATGSKWKAFGWALLSGLTEPIGGIVGYAVLQVNTGGGGGGGGGG